VFEITIICFGLRFRGVRNTVADSDPHLTPTSTSQSAIPPPSH